MRLWLLIIWAHLLALASAENLTIVPLTSPLYVFSEGWQGQTNGVFTGNASTSGGSVMFSFKGTLLSIPITTDPSADVVWWIDGISWGPIYHQSGAVQNIALEDDDHQVMLKVQSGPWVFNGFALPTSNITSQYYLPSTYGVNATSAPPQALTLDNTNNCFKYSDGWDVYNVPSDDWMHYGGNIGTSLYGNWNLAITVYFQGTDILMFGPEIAFRDKVTMSVTVDSNLAYTVNLGFLQQDIPLYQKLIWPVWNLTDALHTVTFTFHLHDNDDSFSVDFFRVIGTPRDCSTITEAIPQGNGDTPESISGTSWLMETWAFIFAFFIAVVFGLRIAVRIKERRRARRQQEAAALLREQTSSADKTDVLASELNLDGVQMMPLSSISEDPPTLITTTVPTITPFAMALGYTTRPQRRKEILPEPRFIPTSRVDPENSATQDSEPMSPVPQGLLLQPETIYRPPSRDGNAGLPDWTPPPPSYLTELHPHRPLQLLSEDDLSRLVDRVANLRARNRVNRVQSSSQDTKPRALLDPPGSQPRLTIHVEGPSEASESLSTPGAVNGEEETPVEDSHLADDHAIEELARRIVRPDRGSSSQDELT